jgi:8-oxo-dGTP diphosphatase
MITNELRGAGSVVHIGVLKRGDKFLICRRKMHREFPGKMEFPGGKQEPGELPFETLRRELKEELGISIHGMIDPLLAVCFEHQRLFFYLIESWDGNPALIDHDELIWETIAEISGRGPDLINLPMQWVLWILQRRN